MLWLIAQVLVCLLVAGLLGLFLGWLIWGQRQLPELAIHAAPTHAAALDASNARVLELERDLAACHAKAAANASSMGAPRAVASSPAASPPAPSLPATLQAVGAGGYGLFGPAAEAPIDDLKGISRIGPVIEKQLAGIGILTYRQIAALDDDAILQVQEAIDLFPGRIAREGWMDQGARLHREKYGADS